MNFDRECDIMSDNELFEEIAMETGKEITDIQNKIKSIPASRREEFLSAVTQEIRRDA